MKVRNYSLALVLAAFGVAAQPAAAQSPREGGSPSGGGSERAGGGGSGNSGNAGGSSVVSSGGGGGGSSSSSSSSGGGASFSSPAGFAATSPNISFGDRGVRQTAPQRRTEFAGWASSNGAASDGQAQPRSAAGSGGSAGSGDRAVPRSSGGAGRDGAASSGDGARTRMTPPSREANGSVTNPNNTAGAREVPSWSRPRGDNPVTGTAVPRVGPPPDREGYYHGRYYDPYYYYGYGYPGYYNYYNYYYPYAFGLGYGLYSGFGWNPYFGDPLDYYGGSGSYSAGVYNTREQGNLKLKVKPRNAKVYVDGFYVGLVDEFDGAFQKLALNSGRHKVEVRADGYETAEFDVLITPEQTVTFQGELKRIQ